MRSMHFFMAFCLVQAALAKARDPNVSDSTLEHAAASVAAALHSEAEGDFLTRQRLLVEAERSGDYAPAKWHRGQLRKPDGSWSDIETSIRDVQGDSRLAEYERKRASLSDNMENHFSIAKWCAREELFEQCRSHLNRVLAFDTDNIAARRALGYRAVGGEWMSPNEIAQIAQRTTYAMDSIRRFGPTLSAIVTKISSPDTELQQQGVASLMQVTDPQAVPAVESVFNSPSPLQSRVAIDWFASIDVVESSQALARYSLFHPSPAARSYATTKLKERPLHDFVPDLLGMLTSPVSTMVVPAFNRDGTLAGYRQAFSQEKFDKTDFMVFDRTFRRTTFRLPRSTREDRQIQPRDAINENVINENARREASLRDFVGNESTMRTVAMKLENGQIIQRNTRIGQIVSSVANREFTNNAHEMWKWWDRYNETGYQEFKPRRYRGASVHQEVAVYAAPAPLPLPPSRSSRSSRLNFECFVAGTKVVTRRGRRPIEQVVVGDTVLSRNVMTGELSWKPVLRSTTQPPAKTLAISIGDEQFQCTTGHLFWVSGAGWQKASEIKAGDTLHAAEGPMVVTKVRQTQVLPTFNLQVADNATYFVGKNMVMTHDVTPRRENRQLVPGQQLFSSLR